MASGVFGELDTRHLDKHNKLLLADFTCQDKVFGQITSPKGTVTDFATIYSMQSLLLFVIFALLAGYGDKAATIHDYLYGGGRPDTGLYISRYEADNVYLRALRNEGVAEWRAYIFYYGVRVFGRGHWYENVKQ